MLQEDEERCRKAFQEYSRAYGCVTAKGDLHQAVRYAQRTLDAREYPISPMLEWAIRNLISVAAEVAERENQP